jgi:hypothetical protein
LWGWLALALGLVSAGLLFATELATLSYRTIGIGACPSHERAGVCHTTGGDAHSHVLWLVAAAVLMFAFGAAVGRSRPAALALVACGVAVVVIALAVDLPSLDDKRGLDARYINVKAEAGAAYPMELIAAALAAGAGLVGLLRRPQRAEGRGQGEGSTARERYEARRRTRSGGSR